INALHSSAPHTALRRVDHLPGPSRAGGPGGQKGFREANTVPYSLLSPCVNFLTHGPPVPCRSHDEEIGRLDREAAHSKKPKPTSAPSSRANPSPQLPENLT